MYKICLLSNFFDEAMKTRNDIFRFNISEMTGASADPSQPLKNELANSGYAFVDKNLSKFGQ